MLRWLAIAAVISVAFSKEAAEISKELDAAETVEAAPVAQEAAESNYPIYGRRFEQRNQRHGYRHHETQHEVKLDEPRHHEPEGHIEVQESYEPRYHEVKKHHEPHEPRKSHDPNEPRQRKLKGRYEHDKPHKSRKHEPEGNYELRELHEPLHHELKDNHDLHKSHEPRVFEPASHHQGHKDEYRGPSVAKLSDPHHVPHHSPHGVGIIKDVLSPDYIQPTWHLDYRYVKTGDRDYAIADGGQAMILPENVKNHEPKEYGNFAELLEFSRLKKLAADSAHLLHPEKHHGLGYMRSHEDRMEQIRGHMVHEHDRHRDHMKGHYEQ